MIEGRVSDIKTRYTVIRSLGGQEAPVVDGLTGLVTVHPTDQTIREALKPYGIGVATG